MEKLASIFSRQNEGLSGEQREKRLLALASSGTSAMNASSSVLQQRFWYQVISNDDLAYLFDLIWFGEGSARLQAQDLPRGCRFLFRYHRLLQQFSSGIESALRFDQALLQ